MKVLFVIMSGDEKMDLALTLAARSVDAKRYEDLKIVFFGPSQERLLRLPEPAKQMFEALRSAGAVDSACVNYAKAKGIEEELSKIVKLLPAGERIAYYLNSGYVPMVF
ncbi:DsrE family protein [Thermoproteus uzoniensis]|nr:DsrE family protein [Thermoproteus uzoniensis]